MELLHDRQKRYQKNLYLYGIGIQLFAFSWLPWCLQSIGLTFYTSVAFCALVVLSALAATGIWYHYHAFPEKPVAPLLWHAWILPGFILQIWCIFMLPIAVCFWGIVFFLQLLWFPAALHLPETVLLLLAVFTLAFSLYGTVLRRKRLHYAHHLLTIPELSAAFNGYRIVHLSDLHIGNFTRRRWLKRHIENINQSQPDLILITGDMLTFGDYFLPELVSLLQPLRARDGIFFSTGNHDYYVSADSNKLPAALREIGITLIENTHVTIKRDNHLLSVIGIAGIVDNLQIQETLLRRALVEVSTHSGCNILLAHDPTTFQISRELPVMLTLAGHTHGGQLAVPFAMQWNLACRRYPWHSGLYKQDHRYLYVHRGMGTVALPLRIGVPPEIVFFTLEAQPESQGRQTTCVT